MPLHTEARIHQLCTDALGAKSEEDIERTIAALRAALAEHIKLAKDSLGAQVTAMNVVDATIQSSDPLRSLLPD